MAKINPYYQDLNNNYLFSEIASRVNTFTQNNPEKNVISLGIGDVTRPLAPVVVQAMKDAAQEMGQQIKGYCPEQGYDFLRQAISQGDYQSRGLDIDEDEIFVSDGAKCDTGNITEIFAADNKVAICDPVYPVYLDTNVMCGRAGRFQGGRYENILYMDCVEENNFLPAIPKEKADLIYLCFPNNPTGSTATKEYLEAWVQYALKNEAILLYDGAYEAFIQEAGVPKSIYEIQGAKECAIEFRSFSKTAGFTGVRCAYTVVPKELKIGGVSLNATWKRRQTTKFNGVSYIVQKGAAAVYSAEGQKQIMETINYYQENAKLILDTVQKAGFTAYGGVNAPYIWFKTPDGLASWDFFDKVLQTGVVITPGVGFGSCGEGFMRITAFGERENTKEALRRLLQV